MTANKKTEKQKPTEVDPLFKRVVEAFAGVRHVTRENRRGFGSGAFKVKGKIFAMMSSKGQFVVKLPKHRVDELVSKTQGNRFAPSHGRAMKEWIVIGPS